MTLMKSVLLGSAATLMVVAGAQAADLPTKKGAPAAEYVKVCKIGDIAGWLVPGTDTCLKISGLATGRYAVQTTKDTYNVTHFNSLAVAGYARNVDGYGGWARGEVFIDAASNTAYGPLVGHIAVESQASTSSTFFAASDPSDLDKVWVTWAGLTAGRVESFFSYFAGLNSDSDILASDVTNELLAYTASFGGGFSATISIEGPQSTKTSATTFPVVPIHTTWIPVTDGARVPDIVAALDVKQGWGGAHLAGVLHNIRAEVDAAGTVPPTTPLTTEDTWGWGVIGGATFNLPSLGAGADVKVEATYTEGATAYSGINSPMGISTGGIVSDKVTGDAYYFSGPGGGGWEKTKVWTAAGGFDLPIGPTFKVSPEISYGHAEVATSTFSLLSPNWSEWFGGATFEWDPVHNLKFDLDVLYESGNQAKPAAYSGTGTSAWKSDFSGFVGEFRIERDF